MTSPLATAIDGLGAKLDGTRLEVIEGKLHPAQARPTRFVVDAGAASALTQAVVAADLKSITPTTR